MKFTVYSKDNCKYCVMAKNDLTEFVYKFGEKSKEKGLLDIIYIGSDFTVEDLKQKFFDLGLMPPKSVPCIFYKESADSDEVFIGGYSELNNFLNNLKEKLNADNKA